MLPGEPEKVPEQFAQLWGSTELATMTSFQGAEEINICLNRLDDFQPEIKPFLLSNKALHSRQALANAAAPLAALCPRQMLPRQAAPASCTCHRHSQGSQAGGRTLPRDKASRLLSHCLWHRKGLQSWTCLPQGQGWSLRDPLIHRMLHLALFAQEKKGLRRGIL